MPERIPPELQQDATTLTRLGVRDIGRWYASYLGTGAPRDVDRFLAWLQDQGVLTGVALGEVHGSRQVEVVASRGSLRREGLAEKHYDFLGHIGEGGMGEVLLARDRDLGRPVALKRLLEGAPEHQAARFLTEASVTAQLDHPHIVPVYALEKTRTGRPAFAMKLVRGQTFAEVIDACRQAALAGRPPPEGLELANRLDRFASVCDAMAYAHDRGVLHRDLKPANLMLGPFHEVYVMDWGIAKVLGSSDLDQDHRPTAGRTDLPEGATQDGIVLGTPAYMSPEQANDEDMSPASDQYALGLILYELVCLRLANPGTGTMAQVVHAMEAHVQPVQSVGRDRVHPDLTAIITRATHEDPARRYPSTGAMAEDVRRFLRGEQTLARPDNAPRRLLRWSRGHPLTLWGGLFTSVSVGGLLLTLALVALMVLQTRASHREARLTEVVGAVSQRAWEIDEELLSYRALLETVAATAEHLWSQGVPDQGPVYHRADFAEGSAPPDWGPSPRYGAPMSFTDPLTLVPPGVQWAEVEEATRRLHPLRDTFRKVFLRSHAEEAVTLGPEEARRLLAVEGVPPAWVYVGLENGVLLNYPGHPQLSTQYDPRLRPWYKATRGTRGPRWGDLYPGDSGISILLPCNVALYDHQGRFFGVAGLDVGLDTVVQMLALEGLEGADQTWLVDDQGEIQVGSTFAGMKSEAGLHDNQALSQEPFPHEGVRHEITSGSDRGWLEDGSALYVWSHMDAVGWTYVARLEGW